MFHTKLSWWNILYCFLLINICLFYWILTGFVLIFLQVPDVVNPNPPVTPVLVNEVSSTGSATAGASGLGLKPRTGTRSCPKSGSRLHNVSKASAQRASGVDGTVVTAKQNQNREQAEKKNQAIGQLRRLLVQGNRKVEALATVIQHLFSEVSLFWPVKPGVTVCVSVMFLQSVSLCSDWLSTVNVVYLWEFHSACLQWLCAVIVTNTQTVFTLGSRLGLFLSL